MEALDVGPFRVLDSSSVDLVEHIVGLSAGATGRPIMVYALHVGGLNHRHDTEFLKAMQAADVVYADGGAVVWLAKLAGAARVERSPTTDVGWDVLRRVARQVGRVPRVALIGGPDGLARRAAAVLEAKGIAEPVAVEHGYQDAWSAPLQRVRAATPDVTLVGMGAPREMVWAQSWRDSLPAGIVLTCGGWFGFLTGDEHRAPRLLRRPGLEWIARTVQSPRRLGPRYARGVVSTVVLTPAVLAQRPRIPDQRSARD